MFHPNQVCNIINIDALRGRGPIATNGQRRAERISNKDCQPALRPSYLKSIRHSHLQRQPYNGSLGGFLLPSARMTNFTAKATHQVRTARRMILLVTATVHPRAVPDLAIVDPVRRAEQYRVALKRLTKGPCFDEIIMAENSGFLLSNDGKRFCSEFPDCIEFINVDISDENHLLGKGYLEGRTIQRVFCEKSIPEDTMITKLSGRYIFVNHSDYAKMIRKSTSDIICKIHRNLSVVDTRVVSFTREFFESYVSQHLGVIDDNKGVFLEHCFARALHTMLADAGGSWEVPGVRPILRGVSGSTGVGLSPGLLHRIVFDLSYKAYRSLILR